jgi:hypothetical protein
MDGGKKRDLSAGERERAIVTRKKHYIYEKEA